MLLNISDSDAWEFETIPSSLRVLADFLDKYDQKNGNTDEGHNQVQVDLRRWADMFDIWMDAHYGVKYPSSDTYLKNENLREILQDEWVGHLNQTLPGIVRKITSQTA